MLDYREFARTPEKIATALSRRRLNGAEIVSKINTLASAVKVRKEHLETLRHSLKVESKSFHSSKGFNTSKQSIISYIVFNIRSLLVRFYKWLR